MIPELQSSALTSRVLKIFMLLTLQVSELSQEYEQLSQLVAGQTEPDQRPVTSRRSCPELTAKEKVWEDELCGLGEEMKQLRYKLQHIPISALHAVSSMDQKLAEQKCFQCRASPLQGLPRDA